MCCPVILTQHYLLLYTYLFSLFCKHPTSILLWRIMDIDTVYGCYFKIILKRPWTNFLTSYYFYFLSVFYRLKHHARKNIKTHACKGIMIMMSLNALCHCASASANDHSNAHPTLPVKRFGPAHWLAWGEHRRSRWIINASSIMSKATQNKI